MKDLKDKRAIVTGASRGIGPFIARALAEEGVQLALVARSAAPLEQLAEEISGEYGVQAVALPADLGEPSELAALVALRAEQALGGVDVLVNNAALGTTQELHTMSTEDVDAQIRVNLTAPIELSRLVVPGMLKRGHGHIVNVGSLAVQLVPPGAAPYLSSKAGLNSLTEALRVEYRERGVSASTVAPGGVGEAGMFEEMQARTGIVAPRNMKVSTPEQVAQGVVRALKKDRVFVAVNPGPSWLITKTPRLGRWVFGKLGAYEMFREMAAAGARPAEPSARDEAA